MELTQAKLVRGEVPDTFLKGYGYGYGDGSGYDYGYGSGSGDGYGYGDGSGSGDGYGSGSGYGSKEYWLATIKYFAKKWSEADRARLEQARAAGAVIAFWRSDKSGKACNGGKNEPVHAGLIEEIQGPLEICSKNALHATFLPPKWKGDRWWIVALYGEVQQDDDKVGALKREIIGECL